MSRGCDRDRAGQSGGAERQLGQAALRFQRLAGVQQQLGRVVHRKCSSRVDASFSNDGGSEFPQLFLCLHFLPPAPIQQEESGNRKRVAFRSEVGEQQNDDGTHLSGRVSIDESFALNIAAVQPFDELVYYCQVTAGAAGVGDASTMLKVFCE